MKQTFDNRLNDSVLSGVHFWKWVERGTIKVASFHALPDSEMYTTEYNSWSASRGRYLEKKHILIASFLGI